MSRGLRVALGGSLLALVGGGAGLVHVERERQATESELGRLREQLTQSETEAQRAASLRVQVAALTRQVSQGAAELAQGRERAEALDRSLRELRVAVAAERELAERERTAAAAERDAAEAALARQDRAAAEALSAARDQAARRASELEAARDAAQALAIRRAAELEAAEQALARTRQELAAEAERLAGERDRRERLEGELQERERLLARRADELREALSQLGESEQQLALARARAQAAERTLQVVRDAGVNVGRLTGEDPMPDVRGKVVKVDLDALPPVLLVDLGALHGVAVGDELSILRDAREVARLEVAEVRDRLSSARLLQAERGLTLRPGDVVASGVLRRK